MPTFLLLLGASLLFVSCGAADPAAPPVVAERAVQINNHALDVAGMATLTQLEVAYKTRLSDGAYWYDPACGAFGTWGGPTVVCVPAGLVLGGPLPANASGVGSGIFINGREIHAFDALYLQHLLGPIQPGRYFTDAMGNAGLEGGPVLVNLVAAGSVDMHSLDRVNMARDRQRSCNIGPGVIGACPRFVTPRFDHQLIDKRPAISAAQTHFKMRLTADQRVSEVRTFWDEMYAIEIPSGMNDDGVLRAAKNTVDTLAGIP